MPKQIRMDQIRKLVQIKKNFLVNEYINVSL